MVDIRVYEAGKMSSCSKLGGLLSLYDRWPCILAYSLVCDASVCI